MISGIRLLIQLIGKITILLIEPVSNLFIVPTYEFDLFLFHSNNDDVLFTFNSIGYVSIGPLVKSNYSNRQRKIKALTSRLAVVYFQISTKHLHCICLGPGANQGAILSARYD